jgi:bile acid:Na+ symporter, BASS family
MKDLIVSCIKVAAPLSVAAVMFAQGLGIAPNLVASYFRTRPWLLLRSLVAAVVLVPAAALAIILLLKPALGSAVGLAILVSCPPAPLMLRTAPQKGGASSAFMASLHLSLALLAMLTVPALIELLSIPLGFHADVDLAAMAWILSKTILIPVGLGLAVRALSPNFADRFAPLLSKVGMVALSVVLLFVLIALYPTLLAMDAWSYLVFAVVSAVSLAIGHWLGPKDPRERTSLAVECGVRHPALALTIGAANFSRAKALSVLVPAVLTFIFVATLYLAWRGKRLAGGAVPATDPPGAQKLGQRQA